MAGRKYGTGRVGRNGLKGQTDETVAHRRLRVGLTACLVLLLLLTGRLFFVQGLDPEAIAQEATNNRTRTALIAPTRGDIVDSEGRVLATSVIRYDLVVDQKWYEDEFQRRNPETGDREDVTMAETIEALSGIVGVSEETLTASLVPEDPEKPKRYSVVAKGVTPEVRNAVVELGIPGLVTEQRSDRQYPNGSVAGPLLGFLSAAEQSKAGQDKGAEGLELSQEEHLAGTPGERTFEVGADGVRIPTAAYSETPAIDGQDVKLALNSDIQWAAQNAVMAKQEQFNPDFVVAVVIDIKSGKILAIADSHSVDPNDPAASDAKYRTSTALTQAFEPGSTGKLATFAAALDAGVVSPLEEFKVANSYTTQNEKINDSLKHATYPMTAAGIFARSYNTGTVMIGERLSNEDRYDFFRKFGIGDTIDIGLPVSPGIFAEPSVWDRRQQFTTMFGQAYTQTVLHTAMQFQGIANGGLMIEPQLIDSYIDADGTEHPVPENKPERVVSEETSDTMLRMMETVVESGTAQGAKIDGYRVGGKTGTGQAAGPSGGYDGHTSSFAGVAPLEDPQYVVAVSMHRPKGNWRDWHVTDTFKTIMEQTLNTYEVPPSDGKPDPYNVFVGDRQKYGWE
ncbi:peptidoglycan D,D-transpeptidase FtsI family protein [Zhihengliuella halotolerans]|uniref:Cell division protein FtsI (Penicillin-binding protein 3) n=1 Tax=Zhihengliuella halotolerans TaxID=370736 RepID=A0A4Q8AAG1_9MICC|nr:penicillin-binding protein 2 [Zhihengliuella halotolerans]RZU61097.1 cell division protein FtsI (penicillin-binding protein 3) [Zhihengliuella halotolerans]